MTGSQATFSEMSSVGGDFPETARVYITTTRESSATGSARQAWGELFVGITDVSADESFDAASMIVESGSPARCGTNAPGLDCVVFAFGSSFGEALCDVQQLDDVHAQPIVVTDVLMLGASADGIVDSLDALQGLSPERITVFAGPDIEEFEIPVDSDGLYGFVRGLRLADRAGLDRQRETELRDVHRLVQIDKQDGRAGLGFTWSDGELIPDSNYE